MTISRKVETEEVILILGPGTRVVFKEKRGNEIWYGWVLNILC